MKNIDYLLTLSFEDMMNIIEKACPPTLPGDDPYECPYEVKEDCIDCWKRWLDFEREE